MLYSPFNVQNKPIVPVKKQSSSIIIQVKLIKQKQPIFIYKPIKVKPKPVFIVGKSKETLIIAKPKAVPAVKQTPPPAPPKPKPTPIPKPQTTVFIATAYTNRSEEGTNGTTAMGTHTAEGRTISCPPQYKLGTKMYISEFNATYICEDRGGAIKGNRIDIFMNSLDKALKYGKQTIHVIISN